MFVCAAKLVLDFYGNDEIRKKRVEIEKLNLLVRRKFLVSISEVDDFSDSERCVIGVCLCAATMKGAKGAMKKVVEFVDGSAFARLVMEDIQVFEL